MATNSTFGGDLIVMLEMVQKDNPSLSGDIAWAAACRILERPGKPGACVHRMPQGMSSFKDGVCIRCGSTESVPDPKPAPTPGPWNIHFAYPLEAEPHRVGDSRGAEYFTSWSTRIAAGDKLIAEVDMRKMDDPASGGFPAVEDLAEARANARLIMASPELLAALQAVEWSDLGRCPQCAGRGIHQPACIVGSAIAKASGKCA